MMIVRPITHNDLPALLDLVKETGSGLTSLPADSSALAQRIQRAEKTWQGLAQPAEQGYVFVLEHSDSGKLVGVSAIEAAVGLDDPWYNYRVGTLVHAAKDLGVYNALPTLFLTNDHTGSSELCSLFLHPSVRRGGNGALLSKSRFLFMDAFRHCFSTKVVAEMRGMSDDQGYSPFWDSLGSRFFSMPFSQADYLCGTGKKAFIAELMPKHPIYVSFLSEQGQAAIGQVHPDTRPARHVLEKEGFRYLNYIDIFDGGPTLECDLDQIETIRSSRLMDLEIGRVPTQGMTLSLLSNDRFSDFRALLYYADLQHHSLVLPPEVARALHCQPGDRLRVAPLRKENSQ